jgi:hypothetical protein
MLIELYQPSVFPLDEGIDDAVVWRLTRSGKWSESISVSTSVRLSFTQGHHRHLQKMLLERRCTLLEFVVLVTLAWRGSLLQPSNS